MSLIKGLGLGVQREVTASSSSIQHVVTRRPLQRVLAFRGHSIDDVVNNPIVKNDVLGYWKVLKQIERRSEVLELEGQWNRLGTRLG